MHDVGVEDRELRATALDSLLTTVAVLDGDGTILTTNEAWREFGRTAERATELPAPVGDVGENYLEACDAADGYAGRAADGIRSVLDGDRDRFALEVPAHSPRRKRWLAFQVRPLDGGRDEDDAGGPDGTADARAVVSFDDVTERKLAEREVEEQAAELDEKRRNLTMLNQVVRHDIRNEMNVVLTWAKMLDDHVDEAGREGVDYVLDAGENVVDLTQTIGDLTEMLAEGEDIPLEPVALAPALRSEIETLRAKDAARESAVTVTGDEDLPEVSVLADEMLSSVLVNLLNNAALHSDAENPRVDVSVTVTDESAVVEIADDGPGIPDERKESVFERGERGADSDGTGLGLYLVEKTVDRYGGDVRVEDNDPRGAVFRVELPRA
ncbi:HAMP domain-containing histidine kinase (plasmid) [Halorussus vallis]|uniref:sensor histidine kinase n=2 Tax=Halorussus TaxID=1070314 RepID=UPI0020A1BE51|nr:HAMP domain-containing sensor histidine kinase [Halorussus vallis]USZ78265.1 HAMP domain-containing histidine kinase [Halorussus vallis]